MIKYISNSVKETKKFGEKIGKRMSSKNIIGLFGGLATGKTTLTKGILKGIGMDDIKYAGSPSFIIMQQYKIRDIYVYHFDLYRVNNVEEIQDIGWDEFLGSNAISIIEWAQRASSILPEDYLKIDLNITGKNSRSFNISSVGCEHKKLEKELKFLVNKKPN